MYAEWLDAPGDEGNPYETLECKADDLRALLAETRGDEGFSSLGGKPPSSGTKPASEPADKASRS